MSETLFDQGLVLMAAGMGTVFVFLTLLVCAMLLMSRTIDHFLPVRVIPAEDAIDAEVAAIAAAIHRHRER